MVEEEEGGGGGGGDDRVRWGTWEELVLGGAVLRHGSQNWDAVSKEVQSRTLYPYLFTPKVCKAKYEALQEHYSGCTAWFEELRKRRVEELRRELEKSDDSIGSLETKLFSLKAHKEIGNNNGCSSSQAESPVQFFGLRGDESSSKEVSKDGSSAGSFTHEIETQQCQVRTTVSAEATEIKPVVLAPCRMEKFPRIDKLAEAMRSEHGVSIKGRRGKRRRKDLSKDVKEGSVGENNLICSGDLMTTLQGMEKLTNYSGMPTKPPDAKRRKKLSKVVRDGSIEDNDSFPSGDIMTTSLDKEKLTIYTSQPTMMPDDHNPGSGKQGAKNNTKRRRKDVRKNEKDGSAEGNTLFSSVNIIKASRAEMKLSSEYDQLMRPLDAKKKREILIKDVKENSVEQIKLIASADIMTTSQSKKKLTSGSGQCSRVPDADDPPPGTSKQEPDNFTKILDSIMENEHASVFRHQLDSQKRARYRSIVRQHMDLDTIRSRIDNKSIKSTVELLRDLLLIVNNALIFYSKMTREYRCALVLRGLVTNLMHQFHRSGGHKIVAAQIPKPSARKLPAKPRSARPFNRKFSNKEANGGNNIIIAPKEVHHVSSTVGSPSSAESSALTRKSSGRRGKVGRVKRGNTGIQAETPMKVRQRAKSSTRSDMQ